MLYVYIIHCWLSPRVSIDPADVVASATEDKTDTTLDIVVGGDWANEENLPTANAGETDTARPWSFWWLGPLRRWRLQDSTVY